MVKLSTHWLPHNVFTDFYNTLDFSTSLEIPWRSNDVLNVPATCKLCELCTSILGCIVSQKDSFQNSMAAKLHFQLLSDSSGICHVIFRKHILLEERRIIVNSNQVVTLVKQEQICTNLWPIL